jgi:hypothetical protein
MTQYEPQEAIRQSKMLVSEIRDDMLLKMEELHELINNSIPFTSGNYNHSREVEAILEHAIARIGSQLRKMECE